MKTKEHIAAVLIGLGLTAGAAQAQTIDGRHADQERRIDRGIAAGRLTPGEAARVERRQASIDRQRRECAHAMTVT